MREHEYGARDETVDQMSRDGLGEEDLQKKDPVRVSRRDEISPNAKDPTKGRQRERRSVDKRRLYGAQKKDTLLEPAGDTVSGSPVQPLPEDDIHSVQEPDSGGDMETAVPEAGAARGLSEHSFRMGSIRGHPSSGRDHAEALAEKSHSRKKKLVQAHFKKGDGKRADSQSKMDDPGQERTRYRKTSGDTGETLDPAREGIRKEQKKRSSRLSFGDDESGMVYGAGMGIGKKAASAASHSVSDYAHGKVHETEQENPAAEGAHRAEIMAEHSLRYAMRSYRRMVQRKLSRWRGYPAEEGIKSRLQSEISQETARSLGKQSAETGQAEKDIMKRSWQKQRIKRSYQAAKRGEKTTTEAAKATQTVFDEIKSTAASVLKKNKGIWGAAAVLGLLFLSMTGMPVFCGESPLRRSYRRTL